MSFFLFFGAEKFPDRFLLNIRAFLTTSKCLEKGRPQNLLNGQAAPHPLTHRGAGSVALQIIQHIAHDTWLVHGYMMSAGWHY